MTATSGAYQIRYPWSPPAGQSDRYTAACAASAQSTTAGARRTNVVVTVGILASSSTRERDGFVTARPLRGRAQVGKHGEDAPVRVGPCIHAELREDLRDVGLDRALGDEQTPGDCLVGESLREQAQGLALPVGQLGERVDTATAAEKPGDDS